jgi:uncharacterized membrane protein
MEMILKTGRAFYGSCIAIIGFNQLVYGDFRKVILPPWPLWRIEAPIAAYAIGTVLIGAGLAMGFSKYGRPVALAWAAVLAALLLCWHLPYMLFIQPHELRHFGIWTDSAKALAHLGGALVIAGSFGQEGVRIGTWPTPERLMQVGRICYCITIIVFGIDHWLYAEPISTIVPAWIPGNPVIWTRFTGAALIAAGAGIAFKLFIQPASMALAIMIFTWIFLVHLPLALDHPHRDHGNEWASGADALGYSGVALMILYYYRAKATAVLKPAG